MTSVKAHEELAAEGSLVQFEDHMGKAAFVSHEWATCRLFGVELASWKISDWKKKGI